MNLHLNNSVSVLILISIDYWNDQFSKKTLFLNIISVVF